MKSPPPATRIVDSIVENTTPWEWFCQIAIDVDVIEDRQLRIHHNQKKLMKSVLPSLGTVPHPNEALTSTIERRNYQKESQNLDIKSINNNKYNLY